MKERPIIFSVPMVRAILSGHKTQTRRMARPRRDRDIDCWLAPHELAGEVNGGSYRNAPWTPGDRLWVRESWRIGAWNEGDQQIAVDYRDGPDKRWRQIPLTPEGQELFDRLWGQSSDECRRKDVRPNADGNYRWSPGESPLRWRPSIHMPRWASRITLVVTGVRVERLQDISAKDALAEGVNVHADHHLKPRSHICSPVQAFADLWAAIHDGPDSWADNPWIWVIEFKMADAWTTNENRT